MGQKTQAEAGIRFFGKDGCRGRVFPDGLRIVDMRVDDRRPGVAEAGRFRAFHCKRPPSENHCRLGSAREECSLVIAVALERKGDHDGIWRFGDHAKAPRVDQSNGGGELSVELLMAFVSMNVLYPISHGFCYNISDERNTGLKRFYRFQGDI